MEQLLSVQDLNQIENRLDFLSSALDKYQGLSESDVEQEIDSLINVLTQAHKKTRINEIGLRLV